MEAHGTSSGKPEIWERSGLCHCRSPPDLALVDIILSVPVDGVDLAYQLRAQHGIRTILLTAHADQHTVQRALRVSPLGYLVTPFQENQLLSTMRLAAVGLTGSMGATPVDGAPGRPLGPDDTVPPDADQRQGRFSEVARVLSDWTPPQSAWGPGADTP